MITKNCTPKQHRTACPLKVAELTQTATLDVTEADTQNPLLIERGIKLLKHLVERANQEESVGVGYAQFVCCVHGVKSFQEVFNRPYLPSDTKYVLRLAHRITAATGRKEFDLRCNRSHPESGCILNRLPGNPWHFSVNPCSIVNASCAESLISLTVVNYRSYKVFINMSVSWRFLADFRAFPPAVVHCTFAFGV